MIIDNMVISRNTTQSELSKLDGSFFDLTVPINSKNLNGNTIQVESVINNTNFQADYPVNVVGITAHMANNSNSVLLAVAAADGAIVMPAGADIQYTQYIDFSITNDNAADVTVEINPIGTVSNDTFNSAVNSLSIASSSNTASLSNEFSSYATNSELSNYATSAQLTNLSSNNSSSISALSNEFSNYVPTTSLANYVTSSEFNSANNSNSTALTNMNANFSDYATTSQLNSVISNVPSSVNLSGYVTEASLASYVTSSQLSSGFNSIATNSTNISINTSNIAANSANIGALQTSVSSNAVAISNAFNLASSGQSLGMPTSNLQSGAVLDNYTSFTHLNINGVNLATGVADGLGLPNSLLFGDFIAIPNSNAVTQFVNDNMGNTWHRTVGHAWSTIATLNDTNNAYQNAVNTASSYANTILSSAQTYAQSLINSYQSSLNYQAYGWIPSGTPQLPLGANLSNFNNVSMNIWYYIAPNTMFNYVNAPNIDPTKGYMVIFANNPFQYNGVTYDGQSNGSCFIFNLNGFVTSLGMYKLNWGTNTFN